MNTKNNRRRRESVERIEQTFLCLLETRELNEITVSDICKRCSLNRSTFYANYADVYALADKLKTDLETEVMALYQSSEGIWVDHHDYLRLFCHMRDNQPFYRLYFKLGYDERHPIRLYDTARAHQDFHDRHINYHIEFFRSGFNAIVKMWLNGGCQETPEEMVEIVRSEYQGRR